MFSKRVKRVGGIVGAFVVVFGAFALLAMSLSTSTARVFSAQFDRVTGLVTHSEVTLRGAKVGEVASIEYSEDGEEAVIELAFDEDVRLREDAKAEIKIKSLLGEQYVAIEPGISQQSLEGGEIKNTASDLSLDDLLHTMASLLGDISDSGQVARLVEDLTTTFEGRGKDLQAIMDSSKIMMTALSERADVMARILANLDTLTTGLDGKEDALGSMIGSLADTLRQLRTTLSQNVETLRNTIGSLRSTLEQVQVSKIDQALQEIPEWLQKFDRVIGDLEGLVTGAKPIAAYFVSLPPMNQTGLDEQIANIARIPWLREYLIAAFKDILDLQTPRSEQGQQPPGVLNGN